jgi:hypothetical protein
LSSPLKSGAGRLHALPFYDKLDRADILQNLRRNIPRELRPLKAYVVFRFGPPRTKGGKRSKIPYYAETDAPRTGKQGSAADLLGLVTIEQAVRKFEQDESVDGIGICALASNGVTFIDIDNCFDPDTGALSEVAAELVAWGTYTEFSPGGKGFRLIISGTMPQNTKRLDIGLEIFATKGFVTLTGIRFGGDNRPVGELNARQQRRLFELLRAEDVAGGEPSGDEDNGPQFNIPSPLTEQRLRDVRTALKHMHPDCDYHGWIKIGQALHSGDPTPDGAGFRTWVQWSRSKDSSKFQETSEEEMARKWAAFSPGGGVTLANIFYMAKAHGYTHRSVTHTGKGRIEDKTEDPEDPFEEDITPIDVDIFTISNRAIPVEPLDAICPGIFDDVGAYMFIGRAKIGKSRVLGLLTASAFVGGEAFGFQFKERCRVLALALEERKIDVISRVGQYFVDPADRPDDFGIIDARMFADAAKRYRKRIDYVKWLDLVLADFQPRFVYLDPLVNLRLTWRNAPETASKRVTDEDYQMASELQELGIKHQCVIVFSVHGSKRKSFHPGMPFEPFDSVGATTWMAAGCGGTLVMSDQPNHNALEEDDNGRRVFSIRGRFRQAGDAHLLLQSGKHGTISSLGDYTHVMRTVRQQEFIAYISEMMADGQEWVTAQEIARECGCSKRTVHLALHRLIESGGRCEDGRTLHSQRHQGYRIL